MKTLAVLVILVLTALYVNAEDSKNRNRPKPRPGVINVDVNELECDPATQYGYGKPATRCRCPEQGMVACLECNKCSCMGSRGLWRCTRMGCSWGEEGIPWTLQPYTDSRGRTRERCVQFPAIEE